jgi:hypothetical protein
VFWSRSTEKCWSSSVTREGEDEPEKERKRALSLQLGWKGSVELSPSHFFPSVLSGSALVTGSQVREEEEAEERDERSFCSLLLL